MSRSFGREWVMDLSTSFVLFKRIAAVPQALEPEYMLSNDQIAFYYASCCIIST